jgi:hypothetical protein
MDNSYPRPNLGAHSVNRLRSFANAWAATITPRVLRTLWTLYTPLATYTCELVDHGVYGVEAKIFRGVRFLASWRFDSEALAEAWATDEREEILQHECLDGIGLATS